jgi:hypothetical protein
MYSTNSAALTLATAASSSAAAQASADRRSLCTPGRGRFICHRRGILRATDTDDPSSTRPRSPPRSASLFRYRARVARDPR